MELDTLWSIVTWTFGVALASPFIAFGLVIAAAVIMLCISGIGCICGAIVWIASIFLYPFGKGLLVEELGEKTPKNKKPMDCFDDTPEDGACPEDTDYRNCDEWMMMYEKYSGNKEKEVC